MKLNTKTWIVTFVCVLMVGSSLFIFRWLQLNNEQILLGQKLIDTNQQELLKLKRSVDQFNTIANNLDNDAQLKKKYFARKVGHYSEFGREGVENIEFILDTTYSSEVFFELTTFTLKHKPTKVKDKPPEITMVIEGEKRLVK